MNGLLITIAVFASGSSLLSVALAVVVVRLQRRVTELNVERLELAVKIAREAMESRVVRLEYSLEVERLQPVRNKTEELARQLEQHQTAIATLSGALERTSGGAYVPRGENYWPVQPETSDPREL